MNLLERMRTINEMLQHMLQHTGGKPVNFREMANVLTEVIEAGVYIVSRRGKLLGYSVVGQIENYRIKKMLEEKLLPEEYTSNLDEITETSVNLPVDDPRTAYPVENKEFFADGLTTIIPIMGSGERLGTLVLFRMGTDFGEQELVLGEYAATVVGMEILREKTDEIEAEARNKAVVQMAISSLSYSELEAIDHIFEELGGKEGLLVASRVADRVGITRSVIVNALRKLESAGVIESRSLGMKGTYIKVLNNKFLDELEKIRTY